MTSQVAVALAPERPPTGRVLELDGIRGIAILMVLLFHSGASLSPGFPQSILGMGWAGVDLFFVLSGFLITGILLDTKEAPNYYSRFYARRIFRIFPVYYAFLVLFFHLLPWIARHSALFASALGGRSDELWYWAYLSNWRAAFDQNRYLRHLWSLSIEEQFYMVWPCVIYFSRGAWLKRICLAVTIASPILRLGAALAGVSQFYLYRTTIFRLDGLSLGALIALALRDPILMAHLKRGLRGICCIAATVLVTVIAWKGTSYLTYAMATLGYSSIALLSAAVVFNGAIHGPKLLRSRWLMLPGKYSYGLYVWHLPILEQTQKLSLLPIWKVAIGITASWIAALVSWYVLEGPFAKLKARYF